MWEETRPFYQNGKRKNHLLNCEDPCVVSTTCDYIACFRALLCDIVQRALEIYVPGSPLLGRRELRVAALQLWYADDGALADAIEGVIQAAVDIMIFLSEESLGLKVGHDVAEASKQRRTHLLSVRRSGGCDSASFLPASCLAAHHGTPTATGPDAAVPAPMPMPFAVGPKLKIGEQRMNHQDQIGTRRCDFNVVPSKRPTCRHHSGPCADAASSKST